MGYGGSAGGRGRYVQEDAVKLGIMPGDYVCFEPRTKDYPIRLHQEPFSWMISCLQLF